MNLCLSLEIQPKHQMLFKHLHNKTPFKFSVSTLPLLQILTSQQMFLR